MAVLDSVEKFGRIERGRDTSFIFGGPIHKVHAEHEIREKVSEPNPLNKEKEMT